MPLEYPVNITQVHETTTTIFLREKDLKAIVCEWFAEHHGVLFTTEDCSFPAMEWITVEMLISFTSKTETRG